MRLNSTEFYALTPRQYHALMERHRELEEHRRHHTELAAAIVAHTVATFAGKSLKDGKQLTYGDFMPSQRSRKKKIEPHVSDAAQSLRAFFLARQQAAEQQQQRSKGERIA